MAKHTITSSASTADEFYHKNVHGATAKGTNAIELEQDADAYFPLQPIEKKLCAYSFGLGIVLLVLFIIAFEI